MLYGFCKCWNLLCGFCNATLCFFLMIVAKYRNVFSCFWYCKIQKKIAEMQKREQKTDSRNASKKMQKVSKKLAKRCKKLAEIEKIAMTPANSCHDLA